MLREWDKKHTGRLESIFRAIQNVAPSQLADRELFDFENLRSTSQPAAKPRDDRLLDMVNLML